MRGIAPELVSFGNPTFAYQLLEAVVVNLRGGIGGQPNFADEAQPFDELADMVRLRRARRIAKPGETACLQRRVYGQQLIELGDLDCRDTGQQRIGGALARTGSAGLAARSITAGAGRITFSARNAAITPAAIGWPRSVLHADCAAASIMNGRSAALAGRNPSTAARMRA